MEIDITDFANSEDPSEFSASQAELGVNAGKITWGNAKRAAATYSWVTDENRDEFERWVRDFGAWDEPEIRAWSIEDCCALAVQYVSGDLRQLEHATGDSRKTDAFGFDWSVIESRLDGGNSVYKGDDGRLYAYLGS